MTGTSVQAALALYKMCGFQESSQDGSVQESAGGSLLGGRLYSLSMASQDAGVHHCANLLACIEGLHARQSGMQSLNLRAVLSSLCKCPLNLVCTIA